MGIQAHTFARSQRLTQANLYNSSRTFLKRSPHLAHARLLATSCEETQSHLRVSCHAATEEIVQTCSTPTFQLTIFQMALT